MSAFPKIAFGYHTPAGNFVRKNEDSFVRVRTITTEGTVAPEEKFFEEQ